MEKNKVKHIHDFGQSIWLDLLSRKIMDSGQLKKLIDEDGIRGLTSNPSIFEKAILHSDDYNEDIAKLAAKEKSNDEIFFEMAIKDIQRAADLFKPVYDESKGTDGFVSLEVAPYLARDTAGSIRQARELWKAVNRKNAMIKIPGTKEGLPAIRQCISEGININVTLLFGLPRYKEVTEAFISGLEDRAKAHHSLAGIASVASFFLSRIDVMIDPLLKEKKQMNLNGEVAISSAKIAYEIYKDVFYSKRFNALVQKGAQRQWVLWASTSTKDPAFSDTKYVEALIGSETVNTLPLETIAAFRDHGKAEDSLGHDLDKATKVLAQIKKIGIDIDLITQKLEDQGIEKFNQSYDKLLDAIENQKKHVHA